MDRITSIAKTILTEAKKLGADYAQCTVSESEKKEFNVDGGQFSLMRTLFDRNVVITVLKEQRKGTVQINRFEEEALKAAVTDAIAASDSGKPDPAWEFAEGPADESFEEGAPECDADRLFLRTKELLETIRERHPKILMEQMITEHDAAKTVFMSTSDVCYRTRSGSYSFGLMYSAHEGEKSTSFYGSDVTVKTLDRPVIECALIEEIVIGTILGNFVSDMSLIDGVSIWKDKLGKEVADPAFSLSFRPLSEDVVIGSHYTGEGYRAEDFDLIRDGKLTSFFLSQYGANKIGGTRAGNQSGNIIVAPGVESLEQIISGIDRGILVMRFSGGQPARAADRDQNRGRRAHGGRGGGAAHRRQCGALRGHELHGWTAPGHGGGKHRRPHRGAGRRGVPGPRVQPAGRADRRKGAPARGKRALADPSSRAIL